MKSYLNVPTIALSLFLSRLLYTGASIGEALTVGGLAGLYGYWIYLETKKEVPVNKQIIDRIVELEEQIKVTKDKVNAINISSSMRR